MQLRSCWTHRRKSYAPTLMSLATAPIVRSVPITRRAASRRYSRWSRFFVDPIEDILSRGSSATEPAKTLYGFRGRSVS